ncbi:tetratricopeptide repeat domain protein [Desulfosarcina variabilis str. Montpellier]|uniref:tetratricopeptide repeat protein n=1 Tax=Desulfosarcina variabilis TaxID=2300 RepID=UPI003AFA8D7F
MKTSIQNLSRNIFIMVYGIAVFILACGSDEKIDNSILIRQGDAAFQNGMYDEAINAWEIALRKEPQNSGLKIKIASAYQRQAKFDSSNQMLDPIIQTNEAPGKAYLLKAQNHILSFQLEEAEKVFVLASQRMSADNDILLLEGDFKTLTGQIEDGEQLYRQVITRQADNVYAYFKLAANLIAQNRPEMADEVYQQALRLKVDKTIRFWLSKAEYLMLAGDDVGAEMALRQAMKDDPQNFLVKIKTAQFFQSNQNYDEIIALFMKNNQLIENEDIQKIVADALLNTNQAAKASSILEKYHHSNDIDWLLLNGKSALINKKNAMAVSYFQQVVDRDNDDPQSLYLLALAYMASNKTNLALQALTRLLVIAPDHLDAELALADVHYKKGNYDLCTDYLNRIIKKFPETFRAYQIMGNCMLAMERYKEAELNFRKALKLNNNALDAYYYLAIAKEKQGEDDAALQILNNIFKKKPKSVDAAYAIAQIHIKKGQKDEGIKAINNLVDIDPDNSYFQLILGQIYQTVNENQKALVSYKRVLVNDPKQAEAYKGLVSLLEDHQLKISILKKAIEDLPNDRDLKLLLCSLYYQDGDLQSAIGTMEGIYSADPKNPVLANNLAWLYLENEYELLKAFDLALFSYETESENADFAHTLGVAYHRKGMHKQAKWYLEQAIKLTEGNLSDQNDNSEKVDIYKYHLASLLMDMNRVKDARKTMLGLNMSTLPPRYEANAKKIMAEVLKEKGDGGEAGSRERKSGSSEDMEMKDSRIVGF